MALTGWPEEPGLPPPGPVLERAAAAVARFDTYVAGWGATAPPVDVADELFGRAARLGLTRRGRVSANGTCRLLRAADGWVAVNLARPDDLGCVPAIIERTLRVGEQPWAALDEFAGRRPAGAVVDQAQLLGVPAAVLGRPPDAPPPWPVTWSPAGPPRRHIDRPRVVDLSVMWAGPLCAHLLGAAGADVVKVEAAARPDGARLGDPGFWNRLHGGQEIITLDLSGAAGRTRLGALISGADVVVESARPRALAQLGIVAEDIAGPDLTWISITGYGREGAGAGRVAFGDDAAVAGGLVGTDRGGEPVFCGDAIADPLTGLVAAAAGARAVLEGGGLVSVAMAEVAAWAAS